MLQCYDHSIYYLVNDSIFLFLFSKSYERIMERIMTYYGSSLDLIISINVLSLEYAFAHISTPKLLANTLFTN